jgi:hypothetical protein
MDARRSERKIVKLRAELVYNGRSFASFIENLSDSGLYIITAPSDVSTEFHPSSEADLSFSFPGGEKMTLHCKIKWSFKTPPHGITSSVGMEIMDPPPLYQESLKTIQ